MYGTGVVARVAFAEPTGIASTTSRVATPETKTANRQPTADLRKTTPTARCITPTGCSPQQTQRLYEKPALRWKFKDRRDWTRPRALVARRSTARQRPVALGTASPSRRRRSADRGRSVARPDPRPDRTDHGVPEVANPLVTLARCGWPGAIAAVDLTPNRLRVRIAATPQDYCSRPS